MIRNVTNSNNKKAHEPMNHFTSKRWLRLPVAILLVVACSCRSKSAGAAEHWPQFRGADSRGTSENQLLPSQWSATQNVEWKTDLPGRGWSSPVVWGDRVYLTTVVNEGQSEAPKKGLYFGGDRPKPPESMHQWRVICLDLKSGKVLWNHLAHHAVPQSPIHLKNSMASETPVTDGQHVYAYFGNRGLYCYTMDGQLVWEHPVKVSSMRFGWGTAASPVLHEDRLYVVDDNEEQSSLMALDKQTGKEIWKIERDEKSNWATPFIWENSLRTEIITPGTGKTRAYDLNGQLLYEFGGASSITIAAPYAAHGMLYVSSGYVLDQKKPIWAIRPGASGDITLSDDQTHNEWIAWCQKQAAPYNPSTLVWGDLLYVLHDRGFFACYDAKTGEVVYEKQRLPAANFTSSPWAFKDTIYCLNEDGVTCAIKAGREFQVLHTNPLDSDDMCMATPALVGHRLLIRTSERLYCISEQK